MIRGRHVLSQVLRNYQFPANNFIPFTLNALACILRDPTHANDSKIQYEVLIVAVSTRVM